MLLAATGTALAQPGTAVLHSPGGRLAIAFQTVVKSAPGPAGAAPAPGSQIAPAGGPPGAGVRIVNATPSQTDEPCRLIAGKASAVRNPYDALRVEREETGAPGRKLVMEAATYSVLEARRVVPAKP